MNPSVEALGKMLAMLREVEDRLIGPGEKLRIDSLYQRFPDVGERSERSIGYSRLFHQLTDNQDPAARWLMEPTREMRRLRFVAELAISLTIQVIEESIQIQRSPPWHSLEPLSAASSDREVLRVCVAIADGTAQ
jgi:hypothetical protein